MKTFQEIMPWTLLTGSRQQQSEHAAYTEGGLQELFRHISRLNILMIIKNILNLFSEKIQLYLLEYGIQPAVLPAE